MSRVCRTCRYFDGPRPANGELKDAGLCRFNAPVESAKIGWRDRNGRQSTLERGTWPLVFGHDWCGEWTETRPETAFGEDAPPREGAS